MKFLNFFKNIFTKFKKDKKETIDLEDLDINEREEYIKQLELTSNIEENISLIEQLLGDSLDLNVRRLKLGQQQVSGALIYMSGLTDTESIERILKTLEMDLLKFQSFSSKGKDIYQTITEQLLNNKSIRKIKNVKEILSNLSLGSSIILIDEVPQAILCETKGFQIRSVEEPKGEISLKGPRDGFVENLFTNTSLIRQRIRTPHLWIQNFKTGALSETQGAIAYIRGLASEELVEEVKSRIENIDKDIISETGTLQEYIHDEPFTIFPLIDRTERPDKLVSCLAEGKVAILVHGTPLVLIVPATANMFLQAPDDYYEVSILGSLIRILRYIAYTISILLPGIYVAVMNFHQELLPVSLFLRIASSREGVPFPLIFESLLMEGLFEILREAGLRLPKAIGQAVSIVGALVLGDAAIKAGLVSPPMVIIVAITAISSFTTPNYSFAFTARILRFIFLFLGSTIGMFGIQFGVLVLLIRLCSLRSFGQPYLQPFAPLIWQDLKDSLIRLPAWKLVVRPILMGGEKPQRQDKGQKPEPEKGD